MIVKEFGAIDYIDFSPADPYNFAVTCSVRVQIYNPLTKLVLRNISSFQKNAYGASFRRDGSLLVAGDEEGHVRLFDANSRTVLRVFKGHSAPVHRAFFTSDMSVSSFSDDKSVIVWDIATEKSTNSFRFHTDYVRAGAVNPVSDNIIISGGYDNSIKMYDVRSNDCILSLNHGSPLESLVFLPTGGIFASAGGNDIKLWDAVAGGRQLAAISNHTQAVTCLQVTSNGKHLISGSLDRHVKFFNTTNFQMIHKIPYTNSILSLGVSKDCNTLAVGQVDGTLGIHSREKKTKDFRVEKKRQKSRQQRQFREATEVVEKFRPGKEEMHDKFLRQFEYSKALDSVLTRHCIKKAPQVTVSVMHELMRRQGLSTAFSNRTQDSLAIIIGFINRHISDGRFTRILIDVSNIFLDVYEQSFLSLSTRVQKLIIELYRSIHSEEKLSVEFLELQGCLDLIMSSADGVKDDLEAEQGPQQKLRPSDDAIKSSVIKV